MKLIITGHADFAPGLKSAVELIAGPQDNLIALKFDEATVLEAYQNQLKLLAKEGATIFTDLLGGTPFNAAMLVKEEQGNLHIVTGSNLPMLLDFIFSNNAESMKAAGLEGITYDLEIARDCEEKESEGI